MKAPFSNLLEQLPEDKLRALVQSLHGLDQYVDKRIETELLSGDGVAMAAYLKEQVQLLDDSNRTVEWERSGTFGRKLDELVTDIEALVAECPREAFELVDMFMDTHEKIYKRCEDSDSGIGGTYTAAMRLWLTAAQAWQQSAQPCQVVWHEEILKRQLGNSNAAWNQLVFNSRELLGVKDLKRLAAAYKKELERLNSAAGEGEFNYRRASAERGLRSVAEALGDVSLFECSFLSSGKPLDEMQKEQIAKFCLAQNDGEAALRWVTDQWQWCEDQRLRLLDQTYGVLGQFSNLLTLRRETYKADPSQYRLADLLEVAPKKEHQRINAEAIEKAAESDNITVAVNTLFSLQSPVAASEYVLKHSDRLSEASAHSLADWGSSFEQSGQNLAAILCYRRLLLDILDAANTKVYPQAARCYKALDRLADSVGDTKAFTSIEDFEAELRSQHGRKRSFWSLVK